MLDKGYSSESANKICGKLQAQHEKKDSINLPSIVEKIKEIQKEESHLSFRNVLKKAFRENEIKEDFDDLNLDNYEIVDFIEGDLTDEELESRFKASQKKFQERKKEYQKECKWVTIKGNHVCIVPKKEEKEDWRLKSKEPPKGAISLTDLSKQINEERTSFKSKLEEVIGTITQLRTKGSLGALQTFMEERKGQIPKPLEKTLRERLEEKMRELHEEQLQVPLPQKIAQLKRELETNRESLKKEPENKLSQYQVKTIPKKLEYYQLALELNFPQKLTFNVDDINNLPSISTRSKHRESNIAFMKELRDAYLDIPFEFRDKNSPPVYIVDRIKKRNGTKSGNINGLYHETSDPKTGKLLNRSIDIAGDPKIRTHIDTKWTITHEVGHYHGEKLKKEYPERYEEFRKEYWNNYSQMRRNNDNFLIGKIGDACAECFAEGFTEYVSGKTNQYKTSGKSYFEDYPFMKNFFIKQFGTKHYKPIKEDSSFETSDFYSYLIGIAYKEDGTYYDGIASVPDMISEEKAMKLISKEKAWIIKPLFKKDFDESKGRWITSKGKHIFIPEGHSLQFGEGGKYETSKSKKEKVLGKVEKLKKEKHEQQRKTEEEEEKKRAEEKFESEEKEKQRRRKEIDKMASRVKPAKDKPLSDKEKREEGIKKIIEKKGYKKERAEEEYDKKHPSQKTSQSTEKLTQQVKELKGKIQEVKQKLKQLTTKKEKSKWQKYLTKLEAQLKAHIISEIMSDKKKKKDFEEYKIFNHKCVRKLLTALQNNYQEHVDFVTDFIEVHHDFLTEDAKPYYGSKIGSGETSPEKAQKKVQEHEKRKKALEGIKAELKKKKETKESEFSLEQLENLKEQIKNTGLSETKPPNWFNYPMTPVMSSFVKGVGGYKGHLLVEYHHAPGKIFGYQVHEQASQMVPELLEAESKGGWVWDKLLGKPSQFGMAKGTFHAFTNQQGQPQFFTSKGAQFVHHLGRPVTFNVNPVGYMGAEGMKGTKENYEQIAETGKVLKEKLVEPPTSREPIRASKLQAYQKQQKELLNQILVDIEKLKPTKDYVGNIKDFLTEDVITKILDEHGAKNQYLMVKASAPNSEPDYIYITITEPDGEQTVIEVDSKKIIELAEEVKAREIKKGRGWWGDPERHAKARKEGKADFDEDLSFKKYQKQYDEDEIFEYVSLYKGDKEVGSLSYSYVINTELEKPKWDVQIENFGVDEEFRGKGYGSLILKESLKDIDEKGLSVELGATFSSWAKEKGALDREELIGFYKKYGFREATEQEEKEWKEKYGTPLNKNPLEQISMFREKGKGKGWFGEPERHSKARKTGKADFTLTHLGNIHDYYEHKDFTPLASFTPLEQDFITNDFVVLHGAIARDGSYDYYKGGNKITLYKNFENLKDIYSKYDYLPMKITEELGAHHAEELGFGFNFKPNEETHEIEADLVIIDPTKFNEIKDKDYQVSPGYHDHIDGDIQYILDLDHIALSLHPEGAELSRACTGVNDYGKSCTAVRKIYDQNQEVVN